MKKILKYLPLLSLMFFACNPMDEVYDKLDANIKPYHEDITYTLIADDYSSASKAALKIAENKDDSAQAKSIASSLAFNSRFAAADFVPAIVANKFPALNLNSTALVTYNIYDKQQSIINYESAQIYKLATDDYKAVGGDVEKNGYFFPLEPAEKYIPTLLAAKYPEATANSYAFVTYNLSDTDPGGSTIVINEKFDGYEKYDTINKNGWQSYSETGSYAWTARIFDENPYAQASAYNAEGEEVFYLISPALELPEGLQNSFSFDIKIGYFTHEGLSILISDEYNGSNFSDAYWEDITSNFTIPVEPAEGYSPAFIEAGKFDLSKYSGTVYIAFKYTGNGASDPAKTTTYQIDNVLVKGVSTKKAAKAELYTIYNDLYMFNGTTWAKDNNTVVPDPDDYSAMGITSFSSSALPSFYLPIFLGSNLPYAIDGTSKTVIYLYNNSVTANEYVRQNGTWNLSGPVFERTGQFVYVADGWVFDPTVKFSPSAADIQLLVDYVYSTYSRDYGSNYGNDEFYFGGSAYYVNFDLRISNRTKYSIPGFENLETEAAVDLSWNRVEEGLIVLLGLKFPEAVAEVSGLQVYYWLTFNTYENDLSKKVYTGIFKFVEGTGFVRDTEREDKAVADGELELSAVSWNR